MNTRYVGMAALMLLSGCGTGSGKEVKNEITCINNQPLQVTEPPGFAPVISGDGAVVGDVTNPNGTHTFTISGCNFDITGDTTIQDSGNTNSDSHNQDSHNA